MNRQIAIQTSAQKLRMDVTHLGIAAFQFVLRAQVAHLSVEAGCLHRQRPAAHLP
jgi:hypothetical protein